MIWSGFGFTLVCPFGSGCGFTLVCRAVLAVDLDGFTSSSDPAGTSSGGRVFFCSTHFFVSYVGPHVSRIDILVEGAAAVFEPGLLVVLMCGACCIASRRVAGGDASRVCAWICKRRRFVGGADSGLSAAFGFGFRNGFVPCAAFGSGCRSRRARCLVELAGEPAFRPTFAPVGISRDC